MSTQEIIKLINKFPSRYPRRCLFQFLVALISSSLCTSMICPSSCRRQSYKTASTSHKQRLLLSSHTFAWLHILMHFTLLALRIRYIAKVEVEEEVVDKDNKHNDVWGYLNYFNYLPDSKNDSINKHHNIQIMWCLVITIHN